MQSGNVVRARFAFKAQIPGLNLAVALALVEVPGFGWVNPRDYFTA
jgi:hypothetical protein